MTKAALRGVCTNVMASWRVLDKGAVAVAAYVTEDVLSSKDDHVYTTQPFMCMYKVYILEICT